MKIKKAWSLIGVILVFITITLSVVSNLAFKASNDIVLGKREAIIDIILYGQVNTLSFILSLVSSGLVLLLAILSYVFTNSKNEDKHTVVWTYIITIVLVSISLIFNIFLLKDQYQFLNIGDAKSNFIPGKNVASIFIENDDLTNTTDAYSKLQMKSILSIVSYFLYLWVLISASVALHHTFKIKKGTISN